MEESRILTTETRTVISLDGTMRHVHTEHAFSGGFGVAVIWVPGRGCSHA